MPILIPSARTDTRPGVPCAWSCSVCQAAFDLGPLRGKALSPGQRAEINRQFKLHCEQVHPGRVPVIGLDNEL